MNISKSSITNRVILKIGVLLYFIFCLPGLAQAQWATTTNGNDSYHTNSGNVGIGTSASTHPEDHLTLDGTAPVLTLRSGGWLKLRPTANDWDMRLGSSGSGNSMWMGVFSGGDLLNPRMVITAPGNVGIGTASPTLKLHVVGNSTPDTDPVALTVSDPTNGNERITLGYDITNHWGTIQAINTGVAVKPLLLNPRGGTVGIGYVNAGATAALAVNGNVGIGTSNPAESLEVNGNIRLSNNGFITSTAGHLLMSGATYTYLRAGTDVRIADNSNANVLIAAGGGNVGIGTFSPDVNYKLDVEGSVKVSGNITAKYQDVAEWVATSKDLPVASVVVLDVNHSNQVTTSFKGYDTRVAGVVSGKPGLVLGEDGAGKAMIATVGRVKVKVDATRQPIHVGDLLVTGTLEGTAMKSVPVNIGGVEMHRPGTLIGKALEPLEKGTGEILVLLSLQ
jgi:hypothetical protein